MEGLKLRLKEALDRAEASAADACTIDGKTLPKIMDETGNPKNFNVNVNGNSKPVVPVLQFYSKLPKPDDVLQVKIRESAREILLMKKSQDLLTHDELTELYRTLEKYAYPSLGENEDKYMGFRNYNKMVASLSPKFQKILTPSDGPAFLKLITNDPYMRVSITIIFNYIMRKTWLSQTRISLSMFDDSGEGFIKEQQLENYIKELTSSLTQLKGLDPSFLPFYLCTAVRKFFFFLDTNKTGRVKILDILASGLIDELLDLREDAPVHPSNWFCLDSAFRVYGHYMQLDTSKNGMLSTEELINYSKGEMTLTESFVHRVFQECLTFKGEMDYRTYLDFVLANENPTEVQSIKYFFRIMDIHNKGYLDAFTLNYFYKDIVKNFEKNKQDVIPFEDVKDEVFDMIRPEDPLKITLHDLLRSGCGHILFMIFTDFQGFWRHESKEGYNIEENSQVQAQQVVP